MRYLFIGLLILSACSTDPDYSQAIDLNDSSEPIAVVTYADGDQCLYKNWTLEYLITYNPQYDSKGYRVVDLAGKTVRQTYSELRIEGNDGATLDIPQKWLKEIRYEPKDNTRNEPSGDIGTTRFLLENSDDFVVRATGQAAFYPLENGNWNLGGKSGLSPHEVYITGEIINDDCQHLLQSVRINEKWFDMRFHPVRVQIFG